MSKSTSALPAHSRHFATMNAALVAAIAYAALSILGALFLYSDWTREAAKSEPVQFIDALFLATSAVSTTGLATLDPASTFSFTGELVLLILIQIGGVGYMTFMSYAFLIVRDKLSPLQSDLTRSGFGLNQEYSIPRFVRQVVIATLVIETVGAVVLSLLFIRAGVADPIWNGIFHAISAFCTAGFSLFATSLEAFKSDAGVLYVIATLSYLGAIGFIVIAEITNSSTNRGARLSPTTRLILSVTLGLGLFGTLFLSAFEPSILALPLDQRFQNAFFQAMTASTTVGFNSVPIGALAPSSIMILYLLMFVGASPSGTGGGLKSTTAALLVANVIATLRGQSDVISAGVRVPNERVRQAAATLVVALGVIFVAVVLLDMSGNYAFDKALFEVISALGTVGLSMGLTGELNTFGKAVIIAVMYIGRVGILAFFLAFAVRVARDSLVRTPVRDVMI